jgi:hypothetical protein
VDTGCVLTNYQRSKHPAVDWKNKKPFKTAFVRPDRFRFEFSDSFPNSTKYHRYIIAATGSDVSTWWDIRPGVERAESLSMAIAGATGVSSGSAYEIPTLLMRDLFPPKTNWSHVEFARLDDGEIEDSLTFRIERRYRIDPAAQQIMRDEATKALGWSPPEFDHLPDVFWIDQRSFLIRRIDHSFRHRFFDSDSVTTYEPLINEAVPDELLRFDPPETQG